ncbi:hypothetical protein B0O80DRAFT_442629 [Mortierella sp. GBAus27b]|nr:hypothetical protein B0O80DRAFT_442629 [Mortierella sp. GBAus27b]
MHTHLTCPSDVTVLYRFPNTLFPSLFFKNDSSLRRSAPSNASLFSICSSTPSELLMSSAVTFSRHPMA